MPADDSNSVSALGVESIIIPLLSFQKPDSPNGKQHHLQHVVLAGEEDVSGGGFVL